MDMKKLIERINFLYKKSKEEGLTKEEKVEQQKLRREYIDIIKGNVKVQLEGVEKIPKPNRKN
ncbi:DUF896 domain-containing protein [Clostridium botulinum]|uniref:UPF0291 protein CLM_2971 n=3 Tax=Clostridium botulinum TaxID=1491 RepID=Y2971_CLOBJ|nr:DUF896 domain-containing protein [Clostridium botulinum]C1FTL9.1 RecName: Full=UPF0291 protein CLM_2971 [Clostridium botulinum A2 str. Kyoto]EKN40503.1 hypothetical protein CFSAN001627_19163 [Clostridium botulinum CFSAN001627]ACO85974.1 conserved hypothetical protein [Clostridium botulinum A2 str. Kyoto]APC78966.1 hypothetical protein NPD2_1118 [Clostridium botulinum]APC83075.1 hypothetical protein NPD12_2655 [Clostridium botulinum]APH23769.1 hypothetical protein NPD1_6 [Clostridium botuli